MSRRPILHVLAGPNGAGKSTLYRNQIEPRFPDAEFVNADELAKGHYGHAALTPEESQMGQRLADGRRRELMAQGKSLATESTFSHPSKLALVREAKAAGYGVRLYHVNVRSADLSVKRVARRVDEGGHPVPEDKTRERYERNQPLIRQAALIADRADVFDNSEFGKNPVRVLTLRDGQATFVSEKMPTWARTLYADELRAYAPERLNRPASSFAQAQQMTKSELGPEARTAVVRSQGGAYAGKIIAETDLHIVQAVSGKTAVAHFKSRLDHVPVVGEDDKITYTAQGTAKVKARAQGQGRDQGAGADVTPQERADQAAASALLDQPPAQAVKDYPRLAGAYATIGAYDAALKAQGVDEKQRGQAIETMRQALARQVMDGRYPAVKTAQVRFPNAPEKGAGPEQDPPELGQ